MCGNAAGSGQPCVIQRTSSAAVNRRAPSEQRCGSDCGLSARDGTAAPGSQRMFARHAARGDAIDCGLAGMRRPPAADRSDGRRADSRAAPPRRRYCAASPPVGHLWPFSGPVCVSGARCAPPLLPGVRGCRYPVFTTAVARCAHGCRLAGTTVAAAGRWYRDIANRCPADCGRKQPFDRLRLAPLEQQLLSLKTPGLLN